MPREKLMNSGAQSLSDTELLAIFFRTGIKGKPVCQFSQSVIDHFGSLHALMTSSQDDFLNFHGLGVATYTQIKAVMELSYRFYASEMKSDNFLSSPQATYHYLVSQFSCKDRESFYVLFLNNQHRIICSEALFVGTYDCVDVYPREIVRYALKYNAAALILSHNHPSGISTPSQADKDITNKIIRVCDLFDIRILDHIIIGIGEYTSFLDEGLL